MSNLKFKLDKYNASQGKPHGGIDGLYYTDVAVEQDNEYRGSFGGFTTKEAAALVLAAPEVCELLRAIVHEYDNTYDGDQDANGHWTAAASIPVETMERAKALVSKL